MSKKSGNRKVPRGIVAFDDHAEYITSPMRPVLYDLRSRVLGIDKNLNEKCTSEQRIAYSVPGGKVFLEVKVRREAIDLHLADGSCPDRAGIADDIPASYKWHHELHPVRLTPV